MARMYGAVGRKRGDVDDGGESVDKGEYKDKMEDTLAAEAQRKIGKLVREAGRVGRRVAYFLF